MTNKHTAREIIASSTYMTLATCRGGEPWACALFMGLDEGYNFYFVSGCQTKHVQNVLQNPNVSLAIFDSHAIPGSANGVQLSGMCRRLVGQDIQAGIDAIYARRYPDPKIRAARNLTVQEFSKPDTDPRARHIYKITPEHIYVLDKTSGEDARVEIRLA